MSIDISDSELADILIARLNKLIEDPHVRADIDVLIDVRVPVCPATREHPTIVTYDECVGTLGLLNGLMSHVGGEGEYKGYGRITAEYDDDENLLRFRRTVA
jgi:hypothetical protein